MEFNRVMDIVKNITPGTFFRLDYCGNIPVKAEYKKLGIEVVKFGSIITRTGINYSNINGVDIKDVVNNRLQNYRHNFVWEIPRTISYNTNTKKYYLNFYPVVHTNCNYTFVLYMKGCEVAAYKTLTDPDISYMVIPSYFNQKDSKVNKISIDNILYIGQHDPKEDWIF